MQHREELSAPETIKKRLSFEEVKARHFGERGTPERERLESSLALDVAVHQIKKLRKAKNLTQEQLGEMIGVKKAQISRLEKGDANVTIGTLSKVFKALNANVTLYIKMDEPEKVALHL